MSGHPPEAPVVDGYTPADHVSDRQPENRPASADCPGARLFANGVAFSTVRLRTRVTRGTGSRSAALAIVFKLVDSAQQRWRAVNAPRLVALVRAGARFERSRRAERPEAVAA